MAPARKSEFTILKLTYVPFVILKSNYTCVRKQNSPTMLGLTNARNWFSGVMAVEKPKLSADIPLSFTEWSFRTHYKSFLTINNNIYDELYVILGGEVVYWLYHSSAPQSRLQGSKNLRVAYCPCCLHLQYKYVIAGIKFWIEKGF